MKKYIFFFLAALCYFCIDSCVSRIDREVWIDFVVENQCNNTVVIKLYTNYLNSDSVPYYIFFDRLYPYPTTYSNITFDRNNGLITMPSGAILKYYKRIRSASKKKEIDVEANSQQIIEQIFTDSITIIFSDGTSLLHTLNGTTTNNILKRESYSRTSEYAYTYTITEADHQAAKAASVR